MFRGAESTPRDRPSHREFNDRPNADWIQISPVGNQRAIDLILARRRASMMSSIASIVSSSCRSYGISYPAAFL